MSAPLVIAFEEVDEQLTRRKHGHVGERVSEIEVDVVDFNLGESKLDDSFGTNEGWIWPTGGEGHLVWPTALGECVSLDNEASRGFDGIGQDDLSGARYPGNDVGLSCAG